MSTQDRKCWIEACQIEQNASMEPAWAKLRSEHQEKFGEDHEIVVRSGNVHSLVTMKTMLPQYYVAATIDQEPVVRKCK